MEATKWRIVPKHGDNLREWHAQQKIRIQNTQRTSQTNQPASQPAQPTNQLTKLSTKKEFSSMNVQIK